MAVRLDQLPNAVACIKCTGENSGEEQIIIAMRAMGELGEGKKMERAERKFAVNSITVSLARTSNGHLDEGMSAVVSQIFTTKSTRDFTHATDHVLHQYLTPLSHRRDA